jgi:hypothetical protein
MKPICNLNRIRSTLFGGLGINAATVPSNYLYTWMLLQPPSHAFHRPVGQEVDNLTLIQVHQNGPVALAFAPGPVVDSQMSDWIAGRDALETFTARITVSSLIRIANRSKMRLPGSPPAVQPIRRMISRTRVV